ncbi:MAG: M6 family metalloprotease domain-containing protein [Dermatophilaceae bacterium]
MPAPFVGETFRFSNPDGTVVDVVGWGNQFHAVFETPDGYTVVENQAGFFEYAVASPDGTALIPSGTRVGVADPRALGLAPHVRAAGRPDDQSRGATVRERVPNRWEQRREERRTADAGLVSQATLSASAPVGDILGLCVLVDFPDVPATLTRQQVDDFCNLAGYNGFQNNGSVFDYYNDVSGGELRYRNVVTEYYTARHNRSYYTDEGRDFGSRAKLLAVEALDHLKFIKFNFDQLSTDGLYVYALNVFYAGEVVNKFRKGLWPHQSHLDSPYDITPNVPPPLPGVPPPTPQRVIFDYQISNTGSELTLFTFCHENGHMVCGFPDLYDTDVDAQGVAESLGVGDYSLMAYGGTGRTTAAKKNPVQIDGYLKHAAGWSARVGHLGNGDVATINAGLNDFLIHRKNESEYFLLENRRRTRTDTKGVTVDPRDKLLPDEGLLIWHVDKHGDNRRQQMTAESHYELSLEQADGRFDLERTHNNYGDGLDLYGAPASTFGQTTVPDSNWWDGTRSNLDIAKIDAPAPTMTITTKGLLGLAIARFGADEGWNVDKHPRLLARLASHAGRNVADILGFADDGVWISLNNGDGTFGAAQQVSTGFGSETGGWRVDRHPRMTADLTGDGAADIVGFADDGVWTSGPRQSRLMVL